MIVPYVEKLITKAKKGDLHNRRQIIASLHTEASAHKLVDELAPKMKSRSSGHLRIEKTVLRRGDNAQMAKVSFIIDTQEPKTRSIPKAASVKPTPKPDTSAPKVEEPVKS